jgi:hypothetical protein
MVAGDAAGALCVGFDVFGRGFEGASDAIDFRCYLDTAGSPGLRFILF